MKSWAKIKSRDLRKGQKEGVYGLDKFAQSRYTKQASKCRCRTTASTSAFQAEDVGSTPITCSKKATKVNALVAFLFIFGQTPAELTGQVPSWLNLFQRWHPLGCPRRKCLSGNRRHSWAFEHRTQPAHDKPGDGRNHCLLPAE